jgi:hypothetical protein
MTASPASSPRFNRSEPQKTQADELIGALIEETRQLIDALRDVLQTANETTLSPSQEAHVETLLAKMEQTLLRRGQTLTTLYSALNTPPQSPQPLPAEVRPSFETLKQLDQDLAKLQTAVSNRLKDHLHTLDRQIQLHHAYHDSDEDHQDTGLYIETEI